MSRLRSVLPALAAFLAAAALPALAEPDITGPEARAFLGGRTGKIVYLKNALRQLHFISFSDSALVERKVSDDAYCVSPMIHPDGSRVLYETSGSVYVRYLEEGSKERVLIYQGTPRNGLSLEPHWWIHPKTGDEYVIFSTGDVSEAEWPPKTGQTYIQKIGKLTGKPEGALLAMLPFAMSGGRSRNGMWGATSHHSTGMYKLQPDKVENAFFSSKNWQDSGALMACNASISPSRDSARQSRMMHLTSGLSTVEGQNFDNHKAILIRSWNDADANRPLWYMGIPGVRCNDDSSGNLFWDHPEWSTDEDYFTAVGSKVVEGFSDGDIYMGRVSYTGDNQIRRVLKGGGINHYPHLWIKDGVLPARIKLEKSSVSFVSLKQDSAGPAPDTLQVGNSGDGTLPSLAIGSLPAWLQVEILDNGTNAPRLVNRVDRAAVVPGAYEAAVKVTYGQLADSASYSVTFRYSDPVLTVLKPSPRRAVLLPGDSLRFSVQGLDQSGAPFPGLPAPAWTALDSLGISASGWVRVDSAMKWRTYRFTATAAGAPPCTTRVTVAGMHLRVDAGSSRDSVPFRWIPDSAYHPEGSGGERAAWPAAVDFAALSDPAPSAVYRSVRYPGAPWVFGSLPDGRYAVRLHFSSAFKGRASPASLSVRMEGQRLVEDYRPLAGSDSSIRADAREVEVTVADGNGLSVELETAGAALAGLEVWDLGPLPVAVTHPGGGESFRVGDTLRVRWRTDGTITSAGIQFSPDSGKRWIPVTRRSSVNEGQPEWGDYPWVIPDSLDGISLVSEQCLITVYDYFGTDRDRMEKVFSVLPADAVPVTPREGARDVLALARAGGGRLIFSLPQPGRYRVSVFDLHGRLAASATLAGPGRADMSVAGLPKGVYRVSIEGAGRRHSRRILLAD